jgi:hypothetical protein
MAIQRLHLRLQRLEQHAQAQEEGTLHVWRLPEESAAEAFDRCEVDPDDFPAVQVHVWPGARVSARLATPPAPCWMARTPPPLAELERRLQEGMKHREAGQLCTN